MLYVIGTPIGNLDDLSLRQAKTIVSSEIILAEDTRSAQTLINYINKVYKLPATPYKLISYYKDTEFEKLPQVLQWLQEGRMVSLISESGMPIISDPGYLLIKTVIKGNIPFTVIPGPTAVATALIYSGFNPQKYLYLGFLPKRKGAKLQLFNKLNFTVRQQSDTVIVFFESPKRINDTLRMINESISDANIAICREMTKKFEEVIRGKAKDLMDRSYKGELTVCLSLLP